MSFIKATKKQAKLRLAIFGPSGSGKTFSALRIANGLGGKIAFIDSERGSASKYSDRFEFDVEELYPASIDKVVKSIQEAEKAGYNVLIIDSLSHPWQELLEEVDKLASAKFKGNTWSAWSEGTPKQKKLVNAILGFNGHIIATIRCKTEWTVQQTDRGNKPTRVGLAPEQGKGIEYEFDMLMEITPDHIANIIKDRTGMFQDSIVDKPDEEFGKKLSDWLSEGEEGEVKKYNIEPEKPNIKTRSQKQKEEQEIIDLQNSWNEYLKIMKDVEPHINDEDKEMHDKMKKAWQKARLKKENIDNAIKYFADNYNSIVYPTPTEELPEDIDDDVPDFFNKEKKIDLFAENTPINTDKYQPADNMKLDLKDEEKAV